MQSTFQQLAERFFERCTTIITQDTPQVRLGEDDSFDLHDELEDVDALIASIVKPLNSQEQLDHILARHFAIMSK